MHDQFTQAELLKIADNARIEDNSYLSRLTAQAPAERLVWCRKMPQTLASMEFDLASNPVLVRKIMDYKPVKRALQSGTR